MKKPLTAEPWKVKYDSLKASDRAWLEIEARERDGNRRSMATGADS